MQQREVRVYLLDALAATDQIIAIREEVGAKRLREDRIVRAAIERHLITIGEALHKADGLDDSIEARIPHLRAIIGLRNRLVHGYFAIEWSRIVAVVEVDVDELSRALRAQSLLTGTESAMTSDFNYQSNNNKVRMWNRSGGSGSPQQVANPSNTYWGPDNGNPSAARPSRSWEIIWNNTAKTFTTKVYDTMDWTGTASANLTQATALTGFGGAVESGAGDFTLRGIAQFAAGATQTGANFYFRVNARVTAGSNMLAGMNINTRPDGATGGSIVLSSVQFDGGNGFVSVGGADGTYNASGGQLNNYYGFATVPAPGAAALLGAAGLIGARRRRN